MEKKLFLLLITGLSFALAACSTGETIQELPPPVVDQVLTLTKPETPLSNTVTSIPTPVGWSPTPTATWSENPFHTPTSTSTPPATPTATPMPTSTGPHPLSIEYLRQQEYPASDLVVEEILNPGMDYSRYIVSYVSEGLKINALLTVPFGEKPETGWPAIVFNHGYIPPNQYRTTERYVDYVDDIALHGYIVLRPDYRGHAFSEGVARGAYGYPDYTIDVLNALAAIKNYPDADPNRIGMWGHSMGGYITLRSMVATRDIKAGVIWAGVVASYPDLISRWRRPASSSDPSIPSRGRRWRDTLVEDYGAPEENSQFWDSISANSYLRDLSGPVQLHHATGDHSVPVEFSQHLEKEIQEVGGIVEYWQYKGDDHNIAENFGDAMFRTLQFFDKYVKGE